MGENRPPRHNQNQEKDPALVAYLRALNEEKAKRRRNIIIAFLAAACCAGGIFIALFISGSVLSPGPDPTPPVVTTVPTPASKSKATSTPRPTSKGKATSTPRPTSKVKATSTPGPTERSTPTPEPTERAVSGIIVCLDPGHQETPMSDTEPYGPSASTEMPKMTAGGQGAYSGQYEYVTNLEIAKKLRDELVSRGYTVVMTREKNDVYLSNIERDQIAADADADIFIRIHGTESDNSSATGLFAEVPTYDNPFLPADIVSESQRLAADLLYGLIASTGHVSNGLDGKDDMTGINWAQMPVTSIELGNMNNADEDCFLVDEDSQDDIARGLADGIDDYFER